MEEYLADDPGLVNTLALLAQWQELDTKVKSLHEAKFEPRYLKVVQEKVQHVSKHIFSVAKAHGQMLKNTLLLQTREVQELIATVEWKNGLAENAELQAVLEQARGTLLAPGQGQKLQSAWKKLSQASQRRLSDSVRRATLWVHLVVRSGKRQSVARRQL